MYIIHKAPIYTYLDIHNVYSGVFNTWSACPDDGKRLGVYAERLRVAFHSAKRSLEGGCGGENRESFLCGLGGWEIFFRTRTCTHTVFSKDFSCSYRVVALRAAKSA